MNEINMSVVTVEDSIELYRKKGIATILEDGELKGFREEKKTDK